MGALPAVAPTRQEGGAWSRSVDKLPGLGPSSAKTLAEHGVTCAGDLVWTLPVAFDDLRAPLTVEAALSAGAEQRVCVGGVVKAASVVPMRGRRAVRLVLTDVDEADGGKKKTLTAWWFFM